MDRHHPALESQRQPHPEQHRHRPGNQGAFRWSVVLNCGLSAMQLVIGSAFGSLALIGDAVHNLGDVAGLLLGWGAEHLSTRAPVGRFTYGFGRSTQLASLANGVLILMASAVVLVEAVQRLVVPRPVQPGPVLWAAALGVVVNLLSARLFGSDHSHDLNRRAAVVHLLTDAAVSAAVVVSALLVMATGRSWIDALAAMGVGLAVAWSGFQLLQDSVRIVLDAVPQGIDIGEVKATLRNLDGVVDVHHVHVWALSTSQNALTAHLVVRRSAPHDDLQLLHEAKRRLAGLGIGHSTLQLEPADTTL
ncbi:MAG: cation diffusion facilitator family transporter [Cyanobacteriota bacterium]|nr:cation diffusion facilitator family transporter [Cyanobacteriota bacterium]